MRESDNVESFIKESELFIQEIKVKQQVGSQNILHRTSSSDNPYDLMVYMAQELRKFQVEFFYDTAQNGALIYYDFYYRIDNPNVMEDPVLETGFSPAIDVSVHNVTPDLPNKSIFEILVFNGSWSITGIPYTAYIKFYFNGTDTGTWSVQEIT